MYSIGFSSREIYFISDILYSTNSMLRMTHVIGVCLSDSRNGQV